MALELDELQQALSCYIFDSSADVHASIFGTIQSISIEAFSPIQSLKQEGCIVLVEDEEKLTRCREILLQSDVIGVDVERQWLRSYRGYTCLLQLATAVHGGRVFLVDCLRLSRESICHALCDIFANDRVLKIFHAADNDLLWLQVDLGLATRCILDTQILSRALGFPFEGLTSQWATVCNMHAPLALKRRLQVSDWSFRPLAPLQLQYAAADAYFLLPIAGTLLKVCSYKCREACLLSHEWGGDCCDSSPARQELLPETASEYDWKPFHQLLESCHPGTRAELLRDLSKACTRCPSKCDSQGDARTSSTLMRVARRLAPETHREHLEDLAEWRRQHAERLDESTQWLLPDELLVRVLAAPCEADAEAILESAIEAIDRQTDLDKLIGDNVQVPSKAHLDDQARQELMTMLCRVRSGQRFHSPGFARNSKAEAIGKSEANRTRWWLPFHSLDAFHAALAELPESQHLRVLAEPLRKQARFLSFVRRVAAKKPVYENCTILAPDGQTLCTVDSKKLAWYINRDLADVVDDNTIRLRFEPRGRFGIKRPPTGCVEKASLSVDEAVQMEQRERFYTTFKENRCVVCGSDQNLARYNLVPSCYRSFLPATHQPGSHDVLLLCIPCHHRATTHVKQLKELLAVSAGVNLAREEPQHGDRRRAARISAMGLLKGGDRIPRDRAHLAFQRILEIVEKSPEAFVGSACAATEESAFQQELRGNAPQLCEWLEEVRRDAVQVLHDVIKQTVNCSLPDSVRQKRKDHWERQIGEQVVQAWKRKEDLCRLVCECRQHFLTVMQPQFLPEHWDVSHSVSARGV